MDTNNTLTSRMTSKLNFVLLKNKFMKLEKFTVVMKVNLVNYNKTYEQFKKKRQILNQN